ncbi:MAG TPA: DciA family protein [Acidobacteriaceae bacterium]|nr:DciA family protein [Acidobacteriaceae bacterium]
MQQTRDFVRAHLSRALSSAGPEDRLAAAWTAACGRAMAGHGAIDSYDPATATVHIRVTDTVWLNQMSALRATLSRDLASLSGLPVRDLHFRLEKKP